MFKLGRRALRSDCQERPLRDDLCRRSTNLDPAISQQRLISARPARPSAFNGQASTWPLTHAAKAWAGTDWPAEPDDSAGHHRPVARPATVERVPNRTTLGGRDPGDGARHLTRFTF